MKKVFAVSSDHTETTDVAVFGSVESVAKYALAKCAKRFKPVSARDGKAISADEETIIAEILTSNRLWLCDRSSGEMMHIIQGVEIQP